MENVIPVITQERAKISCNFEQVEKEIQSVLSEFKGAVFTEDSKPYAKKHVAALRAQKKIFQDNLREEKKKYMMPWEEIEAQAKRLISLYDEPINFINGQIDAFEEKRIAEKKKLIQQIYVESVSVPLRKYIPLERIYNKKWENATFKRKDIQEEISDAADRTQREITMLTDMDSEAVEKALSLYRTNLDFTESISYIQRYERQKQEILAREEERRRREEEERIRREERERMLAEQRAKEAKEAAARKAEMEKQEAIRRAEEEKAAAIRRAEEEKDAAVEEAKEAAAQEVLDSLIPEMEEETELYEYRIALSLDAKEKLEMYMDSVGIEWERI